MRSRELQNEIPETTSLAQWVMISGCLKISTDMKTRASLKLIGFGLVVIPKPTTSGGGPGEVLPILGEIR